MTTTTFAASLALTLSMAAAAAPPPVVDTTPKRARTVIVMDFRADGVDDSAVRAIQELVTTELARVPGLDVLTGQDVTNLVGLEAKRQAAGCDDDTCLAEIAGALGADVGIFGSVGKLGSNTIVNLALFDTKKAMAAVRTSTQVDALEKLADALLDSIPTLVAPVLTDAQRADYAADIEKRRASADSIGLRARRGPALYIVEPKVIGLAPALSAAVSESLASAATKLGMAVFTRDDARTLLQRDADLQLLGADSDGASLSALGKKMGTGHVLACVVSSVNDELTVAARLIDVEKAAVITRREVHGRDFHGSLVETVQAAARLALSPVFSTYKASLVVTSSEEGARVLIDDNLIGTTPLKGAIALAGGDHLLAVEKPGFVRYAEDVRLEKGGTAVRAVRLAPSAEFVEEYRGTNRIYRVLLWVAAPTTVVSAAAAGGSWYAWGQALDGYNEALSLADSHQVTLPSGKRGYLDAAQQQEDDTRNRARFQETEVWSRAIGVSSGVFFVAAAATGIVWFLGDDPEKYDGIGATSTAADPSAATPAPTPAATSSATAAPP